MMGGFGVSLGGAGGGSEPVFHALAMAGSEMRGVLKGVGDLTEARTSTIYQPDWENIWRSWGSGKPAWRGARKVENLILQSEDLTTTWTNVRSTETANSAVAPDGTMTADSLNEDATEANSHGIRNPNLVWSGGNTISVYAKPSNRPWLAIDAPDANGTNRPVFFDITNGVVGSGHANFEDWGIEDARVTYPQAPEGWYRCWVTTSSLSTDNVTFYAAEADTDHIFDGLSQESTILWGAQLENVSSQADQSPSEYIPTTTAAAHKVFGTDRNGDALADVWLYGGPATENDQIHSDNLADAEWTASNMTVAKDATGMRGDANGASTLTATAGNATVLANALVEGADDQTTRWFIKRKTGTGDIEITVNGGGTWQDVTTEVDSTAGFNEAIESLTALANPQIGIRIVTDTDAVIVGNGEMHVGKTENQVRRSTPIFTAGSTVTVNATDDSFDDANHTASQGGYYVEWTPQFATAEVSGDIEILSLNNSAGLLYYDATNSLLKSTDGTNTASVALTIVSGTTYKIWVAYGGTSLQVGFDSTAGTAGTFDGAFATGTKIEVITPSGNVTLLRNLRHYDLPFASVVPKLQALAA